MSPFAYAARDSDGRPQSGVVALTTEAAVADDLRRRGWLILDIRRAPEDGAAKSKASARAPRRPSLPPSSREVETGLRQLALLARSGLTLLAALRTAAEYARRAATTRLWDAIGDRIESGSSLVDAITPYPRSFPPLVRELVRAGEQSGTLDAALERAATHLQRRRELGAAVVRALFYPAIVLALTTGVAAFMVLKVIPVLETFLAGAHRKLPAVTQMLLWVSTELRAHLPVFLVISALVVLALVALDRLPESRPAVDAASYRLPFFGHLRRLSNTVLFARTLSVLLASGVGIVTALELARGILSRPVSAGAIEDARRRILAGQALSDGLASSRAFSPLLVKMIGVGERGGQLDRALEDAAVFHEADLRAWIARASSLVEPLITIAVGTIVGFVYVAFFLALFAMAGGS